MRLSPLFHELEGYPFVRLTDAKRRLTEEGIKVIDFGIGEPHEVTPEFIRTALKEALEPTSSYPLAPGLPELRAAISDWIQRRFDVEVDADTEIIPTLGTKEPIFSLAQLVEGDTVVVTTPGYPVPTRGALFGGKELLELPLKSENGFLPDLDSVARDVWDRTAILWLNYPNNPTAATASLELYEKAAALARKHNFILASDEAYSELYFGDTPPCSALQVGDLSNLAVFNTLSKRSSMPGYRAGFMAGDPELVSALKRYRPNSGVTPQVFVQRAAIAAYSDEVHVDEIRDVYRAKRDALLPALESMGLHHVGGDATFFLWLRSDRDAVSVCDELMEKGVIMAPGSFFGAAGDGYIRLALVPTLAECQQAAELMQA